MKNRSTKLIYKPAFSVFAWVQCDPHKNLPLYQTAHFFAVAFIL